MVVIVRMPTALRALTGGQAQVAVDDVSTVGGLIEVLDQRYPGVADRLLDETGDFRPGVVIFVNGDDVRFLHGLGTRLTANDEISVVPAAAGGAPGVRPHAAPEE